MRADTVMRAATQNRLGGPEVLEVVDFPRPEPHVNEVLVRVHAAGLNPTDWKHRAAKKFIGDPPFILGWELSGVVEAVGLGVARFQPGDGVYGLLPYPFGHGSHAEYVAAPARVFAKKPTSLDHIHAAALPLASLTAWQTLVDYADVQPGQRVLVHAAAGGVGHIAVQIAKARGAYVIGTASKGKHEFLRGLGADQAVDYRTEDFVDAAGDLDVVIDTIGGETQIRSLHALRPGGVLVSTVPVGSDELFREAGQRDVRAVRMLVDSSDSDLESITELVESGRLRVTVAETFPLDRIADAHRLGETGRTTGKIVISID